MPRRVICLILVLVGIDLLGSEDTVPVTGKPFGDQTGDLQFIVMSDRTGGMRAGVFRDAIRKVNLLHPEFVMSVGDLVDGYTEDEQLLRSQWEEFNGILETLDVPFYYVPGNHDVSNPWMERWWKEQLGRLYYHFLYKGALFIVLHTEDGGRIGIRPAQVAYVKETLLENPSPAWTFVVMHRPLWSYDEMRGYEEIQAALEGRSYTLFSGHAHAYFSSQRNGNRRYILATTGGSSKLRGVDVGEFDHITHVTLTEHGPKIVNLRLDGFVDEDVVNENNHALVQLLRRGTFFSVAPSIAASGTETRVATHLELQNPTKAVLQVNGSLKSPAVGWQIRPASVDLTLNPSEKRSVRVELVRVDAEAVPLWALDAPEITLTGASLIGNRTVSLPARRAWSIDWTRPLTSTGADTSIDGMFEDPSVLAWIPFVPAETVKEDWDYHGQEDLDGRFSISESPTRVFIRWELVDDVWLMDDPAHRDQWEVWLQGWPAGNSTHVVLRAAGPANQPLTLSNGPSGAIAFGRFEGRTMRGEVSIPKRSLGMDESTTGLRFNLAVMDQDRKENTKPSVLFWKPPWESSSEYQGSGVFQRQRSTGE